MKPNQGFLYTKVTRHLRKRRYGQHVETRKIYIMQLLPIAAFPQTMYIAASNQPGTERNILSLTHIDASTSCIFVLPLFVLPLHRKPCSKKLTRPFSSTYHVLPAPKIVSSLPSDI